MLLNFAGLSVAFTWDCLSNKEEGMSGGMEGWMNGQNTCI